MGQIIEIIMEIILIIVLSWTAFMFAKCMRMASYHPDAMNEKADSKE